MPAVAVYYVSVPLGNLATGHTKLMLIILQAKLDEEETSNFRDRLLPFVIGLLRTVSFLYG